MKMDNHGKINQYDVVKIIQVPENLTGVIDIGDIGVVVERYDEQNFEVECVTPDGSYKWLETLNVRYLSKHLQSPAKRPEHTDKRILQNSITFGALIGTTCGALIGSGLGAITRSLNGILVGLVIGVL